MQKRRIGREVLEQQRAVGLTVLASFLAGAVLAGGLVAFLYSRQPAAGLQPLRQSNISTAESNYQFIDPLIGVRGVVALGGYNGLMQDVNSYVSLQKSAGLISASVDFRDIDKPGGFVIDPTDTYHAASLYKVPLMMAYYKIAESNPNILSDVLTYPLGAPDQNAQEEIQSAVQLTPGGSYTVESLIEHMIRYSDNNALDLLTQHLKDAGDYQEYVSVFSDLGVDPSIINADNDGVTVAHYSLFLRVLYNATYLDRSDSERALALLSQSDFTEGIDAGVPHGIPIAQKFGEARLVNNSGAVVGKELSDCGIVYFPSHPYLLCIMTKGTGDDIKELETVVSGISRIVFQDMQKQYPAS